MLWFFVIQIFFISLSVLLYMVIRAIPGLPPEKTSVTGDAIVYTGIVDKFVHSGIPEKLDDLFQSFLAKFLRRTRVVLLKVENMVNQKLQELRPETDKSQLFKNGKKPASDPEMFARSDSSEKYQ